MKQVKKLSEGSHRHIWLRMTEHRCSAYMLIASGVWEDGITSLEVFCACILIPTPSVSCSIQAAQLGTNECCYNICYENKLGRSSKYGCDNDNTSFAVADPNPC